MEYGDRNDPPTSAPVFQPVNIRRPLSPEIEQSARSRNSHCVRDAILLLVMWFLVLCLVVKIAWLVINPRQPDFHLNSLSVSNVSVSNFQFAACYDVEITVNNTNKKVDVTIDDIEIDMLYGRNVVSERALDKTDCDVGKMSREVLRAELGMDWARSVKPRVFRDIRDDWSRKKGIFSVEMSIRITYGFGIWPSEKRHARVSCMNLRVEFVTTGKLIGGSKICSVH